MGEPGQGPLAGTKVQSGHVPQPLPVLALCPLYPFRHGQGRADLLTGQMIHCLDSLTPGFSRGVVLPEHGREMPAIAGALIGFTLSAESHLRSQQSWASPQAFKPTKGWRK